MLGICAGCGGEAWVDIDPDYCSRCYVPSNPTIGWMISEYRRRGLPEGELQGKTRSQLDKHISKLLGIKNQKTKKEDRHVER